LVSQLVDFAATGARIYRPFSALLKKGRFMTTQVLRHFISAAVLVTMSSMVHASGHSPHHARYADQQVPTLHVSASAQSEVRQDWLVIRLQARHQAADAASVQRRLQALQERALTTLRPAVNGEEFQLQTGSFSVHPRYGRDGKIHNWEGVSEWVIQGRDVPQLTRAAANTADWTVASMHFELSRQAREQAEHALMQEAIQQFNAKAQALATGFGFQRFDLHEVRLDADSNHPIPGLLRMSADMRHAGQEHPPLSAEPGLSPVVVNLSGAVRLRQ